VPFFKLLSENPEDYDSEDNLPEHTEIEPDFDMSECDNREYIELLLDTGELFSVPLDWLIQASRYYSFHKETDHSKGVMH
jgi:hypothetical protein